MHSNPEKSFSICLCCNGSTWPFHVTQKDRSEKHNKMGATCLERKLPIFQLDSVVVPFNCRCFLSPYSAKLQLLMSIILATVKSPRVGQVGQLAYLLGR